MVKTEVTVSFIMAQAQKMLDPIFPTMQLNSTLPKTISVSYRPTSFHTDFPLKTGYFLKVLESSP